MERLPIATTAQPLRRSPTLAAAFAIAASSLFSGCDSIPKVESARVGPFYAPTNVRAVERIPSEVRRIAVLPIAGVSGVPEESLMRLDTCFAAEISKAGRAEIVPISRDILARLTGWRQLDSTRALPAGVLGKIQSETGADAVLFIDVTTHSAYPPLALGVRARIVRFEGGELLWGFDNTFDAKDPAVANAARRHYLTDPMTKSHVADTSSTVLQNPTRFATYVAAATFATLPGR